MMIKTCHQGSLPLPYHGRDKLPKCRNSLSQDWRSPAADEEVFYYHYCQETTIIIFDIIILFVTILRRPCSRWRGFIIIIVTRLSSLSLIIIIIFVTRLRKPCSRWRGSSIIIVTKILSLSLIMIIIFVTRLRRPCSRCHYNCHLLHSDPHHSHLLATTGALIVMMVYYICQGVGRFERFEFLSEKK